MTNSVYLYTAPDPKLSGKFLVTGRRNKGESFRNYLSDLLPVGEGFESAESAQAYVDALPEHTLPRGIKLYPFQATNGLPVHSAGDWRIGDAGRTIFGPANGSPSPETIAHLGPKNYRANGPLIAAAPAMLAVLKEIQAIPANEPGRIVCFVQKINAAVRKAEGNR